MIGSTVSHYKILEKLGEGGMGVVYKAQDLKLDRFVALKFLPPHVSSAEAEQARFVQEAKAAASLNHPNICTIHGIDDSRGQMFIVMEFVDGRSLRRLSPHTLSFQSVLGYGVRIAEALQEAHAKGIVHRDIKADNVMVNSRDQVKVMDFGLAKLKGSLRLTKTTSTVGTLAYMAPEQIQGMSVDVRADIFSFGVLLFEMFTGRFPFRGDHEAALMYSILNEQPETLAHALPKAPADLSQVIMRCLEKKREDRYQDMSDVVTDLRRIENNSSSGTARAIEPPAGHTTAFAQALHSRIAIAGILVLAALVGVYFFALRSSRAIDSIAVMPFINTARDAELQYICDGVTENVINTMSQIPNLKVISWSTVSRYNGKEIDPKTIGSELRVGAVLSGKITRRDSVLLISAELIDASDNTQIWGDQYNQNLPDLMLLQTDIAKTISMHLRLQLSRDTQQRVEKVYTDNTEAYQTYLRGRYQWNKRNPASLRKSIEYFEQAIEKDSKFALAYAGLADAYTVYGNFSLMRPQESFPKAKIAALKALELDANLVEAHTALGYASMYFDWNWNEAEQSFMRAIASNPNYPQAHSWYSFLLTLTGRFAEANRERSLALELDPFSPAVNTDAGIIAYFQGDIESSTIFYQKALEIDPLFVAAYVPLGGAQALEKKFEKSVEILQRASMFSGGHPITVAALGYVYASSARGEDARSMLELLLERADQEYVSPYWIAVLYTGLGEDDLALRWLEKAHRDRDGYMVFLGVDPVFKQLREFPRFKTILGEMHLREPGS